MTVWAIHILNGISFGMLLFAVTFVGALMALLPAALSPSVACAVDRESNRVFRWIY